MICKRTTTLRLCLVTLTLAIGAWGCDGSKVVRHDANKNTPTNNGSGDTELTESGTDDAGHGPDEDQELIEAGFMTGSWRVGNKEDNALIANFDLVQEQGSNTVEGYYTMGSGLYARLEGKSGEVANTSTYDGQTLTLEWNPTDVPEEMYTISAEKVDQDTFTGRITAIDYAQLDKEVVITRYHFGGQPPSDGGETAADIDAGAQGGAGGSADGGS